MTTAAELVERVRSLINEPLRNEDNQRSNDEILSYISASMHDFVAKIPADSVPTLVKESSASTGSPIPFPSDYVKALQVRVTQTISGTTMGTENATILQVDEEYLADHWPSGSLGAYALFRGDGIKIGPNAASGKLLYLSCPAPLVDLCDEWVLGCSHADAVVLRAAALACEKINDEGSAIFLAQYESRVQAENQRHGQQSDVERVP